MDHLQLSSFVFKFKTPSCLFLLITIFTTSLDQGLSTDPKFEVCAPKSCGDGTPPISYPFWIDTNESYCAHPNFQITCKYGQPVLAISDDDFIIKDIYPNNTVLVVDSAAYEDTCLTDLHNFSLDHTPFHLNASHLDFFFLYNCSSEPKPGGYLNPTYAIDCASNDVNKSFAVFHVEELQYMNYSLESCQSVVRTTVRDSLDVLTMNYTEILRMGFLLDWTAHDCNGCKASDGRCGYDNDEFVCFCEDGPQSETCKRDKEDTNWKAKVAIALGTGIGTLLTILVLLFLVRHKISISLSFWKRKRGKDDEKIESLLRACEALCQKRYSYLEIKRMTKLFKDKIGEGGFGGVYKGNLPDGRSVAVKVLKGSRGNGEEFVNEVSSISKTSHVNIVSLLGFCFEGHKRALVYEFMANGSLEKFIYKENNVDVSVNRTLEWGALFKIAVGIARGLEYLHLRCNTRILHFDIKPHNILLDEEFCPKISDFGLAKVCPRKESIISMLGARGTAGYIAPEMVCRNIGGVSHKSDVYSYGMMVLEMVGGRRNIDCEADNTSEIYFPHWIYNRVVSEKGFVRGGSVGLEEEDRVRKMVVVSLWCVQTEPSKRPSMSRVVEMLEGRVGSLEDPPKPF